MGVRPCQCSQKSRPGREKFPNDVVPQPAPTQAAGPTTSLAYQLHAFVDVLGELGNQYHIDQVTEQLQKSNLMVIQAVACLSRRLPPISESAD